MRLVVTNGLFSGRLGRSGAFKRTVANLEFDDIFSLRLQRLGDGQNGKGGFHIEVSGEGAE